MIMLTRRLVNPTGEADDDDVEYLGSGSDIPGIEWYPMDESVNVPHVLGRFGAPVGGSGDDPKKPGSNKPGRAH